MARRWLLAAWLLSSPAFGGDHLHLTRGLPVDIEGPYPLSFRGLEGELAVRGELQDRRWDGDIHPELEAGVVPNGQLSVGAFLSPFDASGRAQAGAKYNLNTESLWIPAFSLAADASWDFVQEPHITTTGILMRSFGRLRVLLNGEYAWLQDEGGDFADRVHLAVAADHPLSLETLLVVAARLEGLEALQARRTQVEVGVRQMLDPTTVLSGGVGVGGFGDAPPVHATIGVVRSF